MNQHCGGIDEKISHSIGGIENFPLALKFGRRLSGIVADPPFKLQSNMMISMLNVAGSKKILLNYVS